MKWTLEKILAALSILGILVGAIFFIGDLKNDLEDAEGDIVELKERMGRLETVISIHHGADWSDKVEDKSLKKVEDLEKNTSKEIEGINKANEELNKSIIEKSIVIKALKEWVLKRDEEIIQENDDKFPALVILDDTKPKNFKVIKINKSHKRGKDFNSGDKAFLTNQNDGITIEVEIGNTFAREEEAEVLIRMNEELNDELGYKGRGRYYIQIQKKDERKTLKGLLNEE